MSPIETQVQKARRRITTDRWFNHVCTTTAVAAGVFAAVTLVDRLYAFDWPLGLIAVCLAAGSFIVSIIWALATRIDTHAAAAALDDAAGLRERVSSGLYCREADDPFAGAVVADAENTSRNLTVSQHLRYTFPRAFSSMAVSTVLACALLFLPTGMLVADDQGDEALAENVQRSITTVKKQTQDLRKLAKTNPELAEKLDDLEEVSNLNKPDLKRPMDFKRKALRKLDSIQDTLKQQQSSEKYRQADEFKRMLRALQPQQSNESETSKLSQSLAKGDFKAAMKQIEAIKEKIRESENDPEKQKQIEKQLKNLADQIAKLADDKKLEQQLQQAGLSKQQAQSMMQKMTPQDVQNLKKQLEKKGMSQKDIQKQVKQMQSKCGACNKGNQLSDALKQAAKAAGAGQAGQASQGMDGASQQLSEMDQLEQEMSDIESQIAQLQESKNELSQNQNQNNNKPCGKCNGSGKKGNKPCGSCNGRGNGGMGPNMKSGRGGIAPEQKTATSFKTHRQKVHNHEGSIIREFLVDGPQEKGDVSSEAKEVVIAAERDAADAINRKRVPRRYQDVVRKYFSDLRKSAGVESDDNAEASDESEGESESDRSSDE